jgi:cytochrome c553
MRTITLAVFVLVWSVVSGSLSYPGYVVAAQQAAAQGPAGNAEAGRAHWATGNTSCRNCHGGEGEGGFGPPLAGSNTTFQRFRDYVRDPIGRMPAYIESELTDQEIADMVAYFNSLPRPQAPGAWRTELPDGAPRGQQIAIGVIGCGQCHGATFTTPRHGAAEINGDWEWFKRMVYDHTTTQREQWKQLDPTIPATTPSPAGPPGRNRVRMGNYSTSRLPEATLKEIWTWMTDLGHLVPLTGRLDAGVAGSNGTVYTLRVINAGIRGKGLAAEEVTVALAVPAGAKVVSATGTGYEGVRMDERAKGNAAVWRIPRLDSAATETLTITLAGAPAGASPSGTIRWARPAVKSDDVVNIAAPGGRGRGGRGA